MTTISPRARALLGSTVVWDNHGCMPLRPLDETFLPQLERYRAAGVTVASLNIGFGEQGIEDHVRMLAQFRRWVALHPDRYLIAAGTDDISRARADGRLAICFDIEGARGIGDQISLIGLYYDLGVRWMLMAYNRANLVGCGCYDDEDTGLTAFGRAVLDEMARVGMVACCSHTGPRTTMDVIEHSRQPVIFSHSNARALKDHARNITDEAMRACAATGGVVGINGIGIFLGENDARTETIVRHVDHAVSVVGPDHVGLGLDYVFDRGELDEFLAKMKHTFPDGAELGAAESHQFVAPEQIPEIAEALLGLGYGESDVGKILGGNFLRVAETVWR
jgi:membrane dipeptidase